MENEILKKEEKKYIPPLNIFITVVVIVIAIMYISKLKNGNDLQTINTVSKQTQFSMLEEKVLPSRGVNLPISWGNLGTELVRSGTIDDEKFKTFYSQRGQFTEEYEQLLSSNNRGKLKITKDNAGYLLNMFWALGLANKNPILENGPMMDPKYGGAGNFASTGGWTMAQGDAMNHYSHHVLITLTAEQQALVEKVSKGIYRPCCGNSTHFPDCNHGMAMLGLLELMASQGVSEQDMWETALVVNSYWFPDTYMTIATYMKNKGIDWKNVNSQEILGINFSSAQGFAKISAEVDSLADTKKGNSCGI